MATRRKITGESLEALVWSMALVLKSKCTKDTHRFTRMSELYCAGFRAQTVDNCLSIAEACAGLESIPKPKLYVINGGKK